jgi:hypothetical protein
MKIEIEVDHNAVLERSRTFLGGPPDNRLINECAFAVCLGEAICKDVGNCEGREYLKTMPEVVQVARHLFYWLPDGLTRHEANSP